jgi:nucleoside-diphosphate-sugar epimerase
LVFSLTFPVKGANQKVCPPVTSRAAPILVTGANGFVGSHLVEALLRAGYRVRCMVRRTSDLSYIRDLPVEWAYGDVGREAGLLEACQGVQAVCHCAALTRAPDKETFFQVNTRGAAALARAAQEASPSLRRFLFLSSQAAAGPSSEAGDYVDESCIPQPITWYGHSKLAAEDALLAQPGLPLTILRAAPVIGPRDRDFWAYFDLVRLHLDLQLGSHDRALSMIYVRDLAGLILLALEKDQAEGQTYFACAWSHTHAVFSRTIAQALGSRTVQVRLPLAVLTPMALWSRVQVRLTGRPPLLNDQRVLDLRAPYWLCSGQRAARDLGFAPRWDLPTAVQETATWYQEQGWL